MAPPESESGPPGEDHLDGPTAEEVAFDRLIGACPTFLSIDELDGYVAFLEDDDTPDRYVRMAALAHHLVDLTGRGDTGPMTEVFDVAEELLDERAHDHRSSRAGGDDTIELVRMGLLEPIGNICSHVDVDVSAGAVASLLGPRGTEVWDELEALWADASRHAVDTPRVNHEHYDQVRRPELRRYLQATRRRMPDGTLLAATDIVRLQRRRRASSLPSSRPVGGMSMNAVVLLLALVVCVLVIAVV